MNLSDLVSLVELGRIALGVAVLAFIAWVVVPRLRARASVPRSSPRSQSVRGKEESR